MRTIVSIALGLVLPLISSSVALAQQPAPSSQQEDRASASADGERQGTPGMGHHMGGPMEHGMMGGMMRQGGMCPMMGQQTMGQPMMGRGMMMGSHTMMGGGGMEPGMGMMDRPSPQMLQMRGEMMKAIGEILIKYGKMMESQPRP